MSNSVWDGAKGILGAVAPTIGMALGGPLGGIAGRALASVLLGADKADSATPEDITKALGLAGPDQLLAIKKAEIEFQQRMKELEIDLERISAGDRDSARKMQIETRDWTPAVLSTVVVLSWVLIQFFLLTHVVEIEMREIIMRTLGTLDSALGLVLAFYFGSSASSRNKDETIKNIVGK
jgi:hypothetical protein